MQRMRKAEAGRHIARIILLAGAAGGLAEVLWVMLYTAFSSVSGLEVAREITASVIPSVAFTPYAPFLGIAIHFVLSVGLAAGFVYAISRLSAYRPSRGHLFMAASIALAIIWAINFFIVLPIVNPVFVDLLPYTVTLVSKLFFGLAMALVLDQARTEPRPVCHERFVHNGQSF